MRNLAIQISIILGFILISVLLFIANRSPTKKQDLTEKQDTVSLDAMNLYFSKAKTSLKLAAQEKWKKISEKISILSDAEKKQWLDSAIVFWDDLKSPDIAAIFSGKKAERTSLAKDWFYAGQRFYFAVRFVKNEQEQSALYSNAMFCFEKGLLLDPKNNDAKIDLAACYVEGSSEPMKGISMLREIEKTDSMNVKLQLNFAFFSAKSKQWDRAINRFKKVLIIDSMYLEAYLHLADCYEQKLETENTIFALEKYAKKTEDILARTTINEYIQKLKKGEKSQQINK